MKRPVGFSGTSPSIGMPSRISQNRLRILPSHDAPAPHAQSRCHPGEQRHWPGTTTLPSTWRTPALRCRAQGPKKERRRVGDLTLYRNGVPPHVDPLSSGPCNDPASKLEGR
jgi:hypothetical protein